MILFTRAIARDFRALFARCVAGRPRGPAPPLVVQIQEGTRTIASTTAGGVVLTHTALAPGECDDRVVLPATVLAEVEGAGDEPVALDRPTTRRGVLRWPGGGRPRALPVELILPGHPHALPAPPTFATVPARLLTALHECGRSAARDSGRYALSGVQVQGKHGRVVGTDGKVALLWNGFPFAFIDDVLVPAVPVFGSKPLNRANEVKIGRTATHLVVAVGPWSIWLPTDPKAKFPDVAAVIPRHAPTTVRIAEADVVELLRVLPDLPGGDHELRPVTIDADRVVRVRGHADGGPTREVTLSQSSVTGPAVLAVLDRRVLARALTLGCSTWKLTPNKPLVAEGNERTFVAAPLDPVLAALPTADPISAPNDKLDITLTPMTLERRTPMKPPETNGHTPPRGDPADPLELAEELRDTLSDAATKAARLVAALRQSKKEKKALAGVLTSLKQLNLGTGDPR